MRTNRAGSGLFGRSRGPASGRTSVTAVVALLVACTWLMTGTASNVFPPVTFSAPFCFYFGSVLLNHQRKKLSLQQERADFVEVAVLGFRATVRGDR